MSALNKYPDTEVRTPREAFTAKLQKLCSSLDRKNVASLVDKHWFHKRELEGTVEVVSLWVVGSYARGALMCGDLDVLVEIQTSGTTPRPGVMTKAFFGTHANVRIYWGTPEKNTSGAEFDEAVKLWAPGCDWAAALTRIPTDSQAGRFSRPSDAVPVRTEQHGLPQETVEELLQLKDDGVLTWRFVAISELAKLTLELNGTEERHFRLFSEQSAGKKRLAPVAFALARQLGNEGVGRPELRFSHSEKSRVRAGGVHVYAERLSLRSDSLDSINCCALAFIPPLSTRGPNGAWVIERGPNHPLVKAFSSVAVWTLAGADGIVRGGQFGVAGQARWDSYADGIELFPSEEAAQAAEDAFVNPDGEAEEQDDRFIPLPLNGEQLLRLMAGQDLLVLSNGEDVPLTWTGVQYCRAGGESIDDAPSAGEVVDRLKRFLDASLAD